MNIDPLKIHIDTSELEKALGESRLIPPESLRDRPVSSVHHIPIVSAGLDLAAGPDISALITYKPTTRDIVRPRFDELRALNEEWYREQIARALGVPPDQVKEIIEALSTAFQGFYEDSLTLLKIISQMWASTFTPSGCFPWTWGLLAESTAERRARKVERKARRHAFLMKGKHGLKRPKGKRKAPRV